MIRRNPISSALVAILLIAFAFEAFLLTTGTRVLLSEYKRPPFEGTVGRLGYIPPRGSEYFCVYFTGRKKVDLTLPASVWDECPFLADRTLGL